MTCKTSSAELRGEKQGFNVALLLAGMLIIGGCNRAPDAAERASRPDSQFSTQPRQHMVRAIHAFPTSLDPHAVGFESNLTRDLMEGLVQEDVEGRLIPAGAVAWSKSGERQYTFQLRENVRWSNGDALTAYDYVAAWQRATDPSTASPCAAFLVMSNLKNARDIVVGNRPSTDLGVRAVGATTLEVTLEEPTESFLFRLISPCFLPLHPAVLNGISPKGFRPEEYISNGPFRIAEWRANETASLESNPYYAGHELVRLERVDYILIPSGRMQLQRYRAGDIDISIVPVQADTDFLAKASDQLVHVPIHNETFGFAINHRRAALANVSLRRALAYALDRQALSRLAPASAAYSFLPPLLPPRVVVQSEWQRLDQAEREDRANELIAQTVYPGQVQPPLKLVYLRNDLNHQLAVAAAAMWKRVLNIDVELVQVEARSFYSMLEAGDYDLTPNGLWASYNEASAILMDFATDVSAPGYENPALYKLIHQAQITPSTEQKRQYYEEAEKILTEDMPFIPVMRSAPSKLVKPYVRGFRPDLRGQVRSKSLWIDPIQRPDTA